MFSLSFMRKVQVVRTGKALRIRMGCAIEMGDYHVTGYFIDQLIVVPPRLRAEPQLVLYTEYILSYSLQQ